MKFFLVFVYSLLISFGSVSAMLQEGGDVAAGQQKVQYRNGVLIFLDDSETRVEAITGSLLYALVQQAGPIIASGSLLWNIFVNPGTREFRDALAFDPSLWVVKKIDSSLYLLLPRSYYEERGVLYDNIQERVSSSEKNRFDEYSFGDRVSFVATETELALGFLVNHMDTVIDFKEFSQISKNYFVFNLLKIFSVREAYKDHLRLLPPLFSIYLAGHGMINHSIADISLSRFKDFLDFIEHKINSKLLYYMSCYAAGVNVENIYADSSKIQKIYSFAIIAGVLTDAVTYAFNATPTILQDIRENQFLGNYPKFINFLVESTRQEVDYTEVIKSVVNLSKQSTAQIKLPGIEWFSVVDAGLEKTEPKKLTFEDVLRLTDNFKQPLVCKENITLYGDVPFSLAIDLVKTELGAIDFKRNFLFSGISGDAYHRIDSLSINISIIPVFLNSLFFSKPQYSMKLFEIGEVFMGDNKKSWKDVILYKPRGKMGAHISYIESGELKQNISRFISKESLPDVLKERDKILHDEREKRKNKKNLIELYRDPSTTEEKKKKILKKPLLKLGIKKGSDIFTIGSVLGKTRSSELRLDSNINLVLLYAQDINFWINLTDMPTFVSMVPNNAIHRFKGIMLSGTKDNIFSLFTQVLALVPMKLFFIKEIECADGVLKNVIIYKPRHEGAAWEDEHYYCAYWLDDKGYFLNLRRPYQTDSKSFGEIVVEAVTTKQPQIIEAQRLLAEYRENPSKGLLPLSLTSEGAARLSEMVGRQAVQQQQRIKIEKKLTEFKKMSHDELYAFLMGQMNTVDLKALGELYGFNQASYNTDPDANKYQNLKFYLVDRLSDEISPTKKSKKSSLGLGSIAKIKTTMGKRLDRARQNLKEKKGRGSKVR